MTLADAVFRRAKLPGWSFFLLYVAAKVLCVGALLHHVGDLERAVVSGAASACGILGPRSLHEDCLPRSRRNETGLRPTALKGLLLATHAVLLFLFLIWVSL